MRVVNAVISLVALAFVMSMSSADNTSPCQSGWSFLQEANKCIKAFDRETSWGQAQSYCESQNARLVTIHDSNTQKFIDNLLSKIGQHHWIGLFDVVKEGEFQWVDGSSLHCDETDTQCVQYMNWVPGQPDMYVEGREVIDEDCVHLTPSGGWNDMSCCESYRYICEKRGPGCEHQNGGCSHICREGAKHRWNVTCSHPCADGFAFRNGDCYDIDECSVRNGGCDQTCQNQKGSYSCTCNIDYKYNGTHCIIDEDGLLIG